MVIGDLPMPQNLGRLVGSAINAKRVTATSSALRNPSSALSNTAAVSTGKIYRPFTKNNFRHNRGLGVYAPPTLTSVLNITPSKLLYFYVIDNHPKILLYIIRMNINYYLIIHATIALCQLFSPKNIYAYLSSRTAISRVIH